MKCSVNMVGTSARFHANSWFKWFISNIRVISKSHFCQNLSSSNTNFLPLTPFFLAHFSKEISLIFPWISTYFLKEKKTGVTGRKPSKMNFFIYTVKKTFLPHTKRYFFSSIPWGNLRAQTTVGLQKSCKIRKKSIFFIFVKTLAIHPDGSKSLPKHSRGPKDISDTQ